MQIASGNGFVVNPGSIGQPRDWNPKASYLLFDTEASKFEFRRVSYDVESLQKRLKQLAWDEPIIKILNRVK
jgi:predicted phosphodiesterase